MLYRFGIVKLMNAKTSNSSYGVVRHYLRDGKSPQFIKNRPFYMVNSTYTVASDPNTMRDTGFLRNAQYTIRDKVEEHN